MSEWIYADAWVGGYYPDNLYPVMWSDGYEGILWSTCINKGDEKYQRDSNFEWSKWPRPLYNILRIIGLILLVGLFFIIMIIVGIRKK